MNRRKQNREPCGCLVVLCRLERWQRQVSEERESQHGERSEPGPGLEVSLGSGAAAELRAEERPNETDTSAGALLVRGENRQHGRGRWQGPSAVSLHSRVGVDVV